MSRTRRIYVASSWRNTQQPFVVERLRDQGHSVYDFRNPTEGNHGFHWSEIDPAWQSWTPQQFTWALYHPIAERGFKHDWLGMRWADTCVLLLPSGRSAHLEAGYFVGGENKELYILLGEERLEPELMYRLATRVCTHLDELVWALAQAAIEERLPSEAPVRDVERVG